MTSTEMNAHMRRLVESWVEQGYLRPLFVDFEEVKFINEELAFKWCSDEGGEEWRSWERADNRMMASSPLFAARFLHRRDWYNQARRSSLWIHVKNIQSKQPEIDCVSSFEGALMVESMRTIDRWRNRYWSVGQSREATNRTDVFEQPNAKS